MTSPPPRLIGDYIVGPKVGSGSFAVVWRSTHRQLGIEVAVKEIDKKNLSPKVSESLVKEISILSTINHPNIIHLFEAIQTDDRIYLVLEYCDGGDLAAYIQRHGKVSETAARHFMRQLAAGLQVLHEKQLIHRDLKPQNLLLSANEETPLLKIGDFGFARSVTPQDLADTLCGSPLYMAPEIILNQKYDAKADLWSVGAILFQLVTGTLPFDGSTQLQLFHNVLTSTELRFPQGALEELHPDCIDLCRSLLRLNPVERLSFQEFFNHKFLRETRVIMDVGSISRLKTFGEEPCSSASGNLLQQQVTHPLKSIRNLSSDPTANLQDQPRVSDSMESIEKDYVMVNFHFASMESFSYHLEHSLRLDSTNRASISASLLKDCVIKTEELSANPVGDGSSQTRGSAILPASCSSTLLLEVQGLSVLHPSTRLHLLHQHAEVLAEFSQEKYNAGLYLESFSVELVILAIWKKALQICNDWLASVDKNEIPESTNASSVVQGGLPIKSSENLDFTSPSSVTLWAEQGFLVAFDRAEKLSNHVREMDGASEVPDAMEIIFQKALKVGTTAAVDEYMENKGSAAALYTKAMLLLSFIAGEASSLPLNPPFSLTPANKKRVQQYMVNLEAHRIKFLKQDPTLVQQVKDSITK